MWPAHRAYAQTPLRLVPLHGRCNRVTVLRYSVPLGPSLRSGPRGSLRSPSFPPFGDLTPHYVRGSAPSLRSPLSLRYSAFALTGLHRPGGRVKRVRADGRGRPAGRGSRVYERRVLAFRETQLAESSLSVAYCCSKPFLGWKVEWVGSDAWTRSDRRSDGQTGVNGCRRRPA